MVTSKKNEAKSLIKINKLLSEELLSIESIGNSIDAIFYVVNHLDELVYTNDKASEWLKPHLEQKEGLELLDMKSYFEEEIIYLEYKDNESPSRQKKAKYNLQKVWFPSNLDFKLCLVNWYPSEYIDGMLYMIKPLKDWGHLKSRLLNLMEEEEFMQNNEVKYAKLTKREKELITYVSNGFSSKEISERLFISKYTVEQHRKHIKKKLEIHSLAEMVRFGQVFKSVF